MIEELNGLAFEPLGNRMASRPVASSIAATSPSLFGDSITTPFVVM